MKAGFEWNGFVGFKSDGMYDKEGKKERRKEKKKELQKHMNRVVSSFSSFYFCEMDPVEKTS